MLDAYHALLHALQVAGSMTWQVTWSLILGFTLSAVIEALVRKSTIARLLPDDRPRSLATATGLGAASSSCSYAAVALARSLYRKGADFTSAMAFQFASTNLVIELGLILALLIGWQFTLAEFVGGPLMILFLALLFRRFLTTRLREAARVQAERGLAGSMEGHAAMDMSIASGGSFWRRLFFTDHPLVAKIWGPLIGPLVAVVTFVCSIGNAPLAAVLWNGGISFGGVISFIFADLIIIPLLFIYRKYYGARMAWFLFGTFYATMVAAGYVIEFVFGPLGLIPDGPRNANVGDDGVRWNYTTVLNIVFLLLAAALVWRFFATGGRAMLKMMGGSPDGMAHGHDKGHEAHARREHST